MMKKLLISAIVMTFAITVNAQNDYPENTVDLSWMDGAPEKYLPKNTQMIISSSSSCNQNGEAFKDFIPKFRSNKAFRDSRVKFPPDDEMGKMTFDGLAGWIAGYQIFKAVQKNLRCDKSFGTWYNVSENEVCFKYEDVLPCDEWGGSGMYARFQRFDGKWYLTGIMAAG